jgi:hypothetical protein
MKYRLSMFWWRLRCAWADLEDAFCYLSGRQILQPALNFDWTDKDPGKCARCGEPFEHVRPGKSQPTCHCYDQ